MAMLVKENRELRANLESLSGAYTSICQENQKLREAIREIEEGVKTEKTKPVYELYDAPHEICKGSRIVITDVRAKNSKFPKGFVLQVNSIKKNTEGVITIKGEYLRICKRWGNGGYHPETGMTTTTINNKFYNWISSSAELSTLSEFNGYDNPEYTGLEEI